MRNRSDKPKQGACECRRMGARMQALGKGIVKVIEKEIFKVKEDSFFCTYLLYKEELSREEIELIRQVKIRRNRNYV